MDGISILIVEDDVSFALEIEMQLGELGYADVRTAKSADLADRAIDQRRPDLLLVDILLGEGRSGIELARAYESQQLPVIYMTAVTDTDVFREAQHTQPFVYLVKPFDRLTLASSIETAVRTQHTNREPPADGWTDDLVLRDRIYVKKNNRLERILINDILWIRADGNYCFVQVGDKRFVIKISLRKLLATLPPQFFTQVQKSFAVHLGKVESIDLNTNSLLIAGHTLPMGRSYREDIIGRINLIK